MTAELKTIAESVRCSECPYDCMCRQTLICAEVLHRLLDRGVKPQRAKRMASIKT